MLPDDDGGAVVLDTTTETYLALSPISETVLALLDEGEPLDDVFALLAEVTDGDPATIRTEVTAFVDDLVARALLVRLET
jgi:hypothetical protein